MFGTNMKYEDLESMDLKKYQVPMLLSKKLFANAQWEAEHDDYWTKTLLECAQHALQLEKLLVNKKEADNAHEPSSASSSPPASAGVDE
jgi:hypothetical protein